MNETKELANWVFSLDWKDIPPYTKTKVKQCVLEYLTCCLVARDEEVAQVLLNTIEQLDGKPQASVIGHNIKVSVDNAALINGALSHIWEIDDTHRKSMSHPGDSVIPSAFAIGEWLGINGADVLTAIIAGYEVAVRICEAVSPSHLEKGWHPTGTTNTFGAAAAAGKLLGLNSNQMASAFGIATTQAAGTFCHIPERAMTKDLNPGKAAANGILAALLAKEGFLGSPTAIENDRGFIHTHADVANPSVITSNLGQAFKIDEIAFKPYACCRHCHASVDAMLSLRNVYGLKPDDVESIEVRHYPMADRLVNDPNPFKKGFYGTRYSVQFNLALALVKGERGMLEVLFNQQYAQDMLKEPQIQENMKKVKVIVDSDLAREWPNKWPARVAVNLKDGQEFERQIDYPLGEPENPLSYFRLLEKFRKAGEGYLSKSAATLVTEKVENLDESDSIATFMSLISGTNQRE